ncbi:hypothetical protein D3C81_1815440 [compost metagenome]
MLRASGLRSYRLLAASSACENAIDTVSTAHTMHSLMMTLTRPGGRSGMRVMPEAITWLGTTLDRRAMTRIRWLPRPDSAPGRRCSRRRRPRTRMRLVTQLARPAAISRAEIINAR